MAETPTQTAIQPQAIAPHGEPCERCNAPMAADQRYCLNCGARRGDPRADYRTYMTSAAPAPPATGQVPADSATATTGEDGKKERDYAPLAAVAGIVVLGLMLLIGVLIGKGNGGGGDSTPQVLRVAPSGESEAASSEGGEAGVSGGAGAEGGKNEFGTGNGAKKKQGGPGSGSASTASAPPPASSNALEQHESSSGSDYVEESKNIPNEVVTPGAPPPVDKSKPAGGGEGGGVTIE